MCLPNVASRLRRQHTEQYYQGRIDAPQSSKPNNSGRALLHQDDSRCLAWAAGAVLEKPAGQMASGRWASTSNIPSSHEHEHEHEHHQHRQHRVVTGNRQRLSGQIALGRWSVAKNTPRRLPPSVDGRRAGGLRALPNLHIRACKYICMSNRWVVEHNPSSLNLYAISRAQGSFR